MHTEYSTKREKNPSEQPLGQNFEGKAAGEGIRRFADTASKQNDVSVKSEV